MFFYSGYAAAPLIFAMARRLASWAVLPVCGALAVWAFANWLGVDSGAAAMRGPDLVFSYAGIAAVIASSVVLARSSCGTALAYCGRNSIVIYLAFALFMAPARILLLKLGGGALLDIAALATTTASVAGALLLHSIVSNGRLAFLFVRPDRFRITGRVRGTSIPAHHVAAKG